MGTILVGMATPQQFEDALAAVQKGPLPHAALERLTALQQGIRGRDTVIVKICRASPVNGPQAPTRRSPAFTPALGSGTPTVSSGGQLVASIEFVGHYAAGNFYFTSAVPSVSSLCSG
jgi:hypothetical protein